MFFPTDAGDRLLANLHSGTASLCAYVFSHPNLVEVAGLAGIDCSMAAMMFTALDWHRLIHIPSDLVVDHRTSSVESSLPLDFLSLHAMWTPFGGLMSCKIMSIISVCCDFTTKSGGIWKLLLEIAREIGLTPAGYPL